MASEWLEGRKEPVHIAGDTVILDVAVPRIRVGTVQEEELE